MSGTCAAEAERYTLTVRYAAGYHELYINGDRVGEYRDTAENPGFSCGYVGFYCESGAEEATAELNPVRLILE